MKRFSLLCVLAILCSLPAYSQFWISFGWNEPHCQNCLWMEQAMHLPARQAAEYHKIIHKYGQKIEKEARRDYRKPAKPDKPKPKKNKKDRDDRKERYYSNGRKV